MTRVRALAQKEGRTISEVVNELLVEGLQRRQGTRRSKPLELPRFEMGKARVNVADRDALESLLGD